MLRTRLLSLAASLYDIGRHNEAEFLEAIAEGCADIKFNHQNYTKAEALRELAESFDYGSDDDDDWNY